MTHTNVDTSAPSLDRLRGLAKLVVRQAWPIGELPSGLTLDDLIAEGWLAYAENASRYPRSYAQRHYESARFAMLHCITNEGHGQMSGGKSGAERDAVRMYSLNHAGDDGDDGNAMLRAAEQAIETTRQLVASNTSPMRARRLKRADIRAFIACAQRTLTAREATVLLGLLVDGDSVADLEERLKLKTSSVYVLRWRAVQKMLAATAAA